MKIKKQNIVRYSILAFFLVMFSIFSMRHYILGGDVSASVDALCPFGGFETLLTWLVTGSLVPRIMISALILALGILLTTLIFKRGFCGWICPFGTINELVGLIKKKKVNINEKLDKKGRYVKYIVLAFVIFGTFIAGTLVFRQIDPFVTFFHFGKGIFWDFSTDEFFESLLPFFITVIVLVMGVFISRFWCRYLCPLGGLMALLSRFGLTKIRRNTKTCIDCKICDKVCPMNVDVSGPKEVKDTECIDCGKCIIECPKKSLNYTLFGKKISLWVFVIGVIGVLFGVVLIAKAAGVWQSVPVIGDIAQEVEETGKLDTSLIKGWMSIKEVSEMSGVCLGHIYSYFEFPQDLSPDTPLKELKNYGYDVHAEDFKELIDEVMQNPEHMAKHIGEDASHNPKCPWNIEQDPYPGACGLYRDSDGNYICDLSE